MAPKPTPLAFSSGDPLPLVVELERLAEAGDGWVNLAPVVEDPPEPPSGLAGMFGSTGPVVPHATWMASARKRGGKRGPTTVGVEHASGTKAAARLRDRGHAVPAGWRVRQDHPKRGLVVQVPPEVPPAESLAWLLRAAALLTTVEVNQRWIAEIYG